MGIRTQIQTALSTLSDIDCGVPIPDGLVETGVTYFGYELSENYLNSDQDKDYSMEINLTGRLVRRVDPEEGTLSILDEALEELKGVLKSLNFKYSYNDVSITDNIRKIFVSATVRYNELNNELIL